MRRTRLDDPRRNVKTLATIRPIWVLNQGQLFGLARLACMEILTDTKLADVTAIGVDHGNRIIGHEA
jgi:hypothetical protein